MSLIAINVAIFVYVFVVTREPAALSGGVTDVHLKFGLSKDVLVQPIAWQSDDGGIYITEPDGWYRLVTSGFLHFGIFHIGFNMYFLYILGPMLEPGMGRINYLLLYMASLLGGSLGVVLLDSGGITAGASGAVFGLLAAATVGLWRRGVNPFTTGVGTALILNLFITFAIPGISIGGHIGGAIAGAVCGAVMLAPAYRRGPAWTVWATPVAVGIGSVGGCHRDRERRMTLRDRHLERLRTETFDTLVVGGGINGAVAAASLAGRGAQVAIIDRGDFAHFTSQASSNLVWGGFKYLENYELLLVWKLCRSRNRLMKAYPDNIKQIGFYATLDETSPYKPWFAGLGSLGYWIIGMFGTKRPRVLSTEHIEREEPAINTSKALGGIEYYDGILVDNDARFVFSFVRAAIDAGTAAANYVEMVSAVRSGGQWSVRLRDVDTGEEFSTTARTIVNAAGPFVDEVNQEWGLTTDHRIVYSKGIHLVVPRLTTTEHHKVLAFFDDSQRLFYVIPMGRRSVIGTTDTRVDTPFTEVDDDDIDFLLGQINARMDLPAPLTRGDIIAERCGVRPLVVKRRSGDHSDVDWTKLSRKHAIETDRTRAGGHGVRRQAHRLHQRR